MVVSKSGVGRNLQLKYEGRLVMEYRVSLTEKNDLIVKESSKQRVINLQYRLLQFSVAIVKFLFDLPRVKELDVFRYQLSKSASAIGANYEESQATSYAEFYQRIQICLREARQTLYWLEILLHLKLDSCGFKIKDENSYNTKLTALLKEIKEINLIFGAISSKIKKSR